MKVQDEKPFISVLLDFPGGSDGKASVYNAGDPGSISGSGRSPGEGNGNPLQNYCLENPMDRGVWQAAVYGVAKSRTRLSDFTSLQWVKSPPAIQETQETLVPFLGQENPLDDGMATHSSILARTEEPGRLQSIASQRVGHS